MLAIILGSLFILWLLPSSNVKDRPPWLVKEGMSLNTPKIAIITAVIGGYDDIKEQNNVLNRDRVDWYYFTDNDKVKSEHWKVIHVDKSDVIKKNSIGNSKSKNYLPKLNDDKQKNMMIAKYYKAQTHKIEELQEYDYFVWVDGSIQLDDKFVNNMCNLLVDDKKELVHFKHSVRNNIKDEVDASYQAYPKKYESQDLRSQYKQYIEDGFEDNMGLFEMTIFARKNTEKNNNLFDMWWKENIDKSFQDQISYPYCLWKCGLKPDHVINLNVFDNTEYSKASGDTKKHAW